MILAGKCSSCFEYLSITLFLSGEFDKKIGISNLYVFTYHATDEAVTRRNLGAFAGWPGPNDWVHQIGIQHCCTGNGTRTLYYAWEHIVQAKKGILRVNLLLNRASMWADVYSFIPYQGKVAIRMKKAISLLVRAPAWVGSTSNELKCLISEI